MTKTKLDYIYVGIQFGLFIAFVFPVDLGIQFPDYPRWPSQLVVIVGLLEILWAFAQMRNFLTAWPTPKDQTELITWGIFGVVRHPIYGGLFLMLSGLAFYQASLYKLLVSFSLLLLFFFKSRYEEKRLCERFPKQYLRYREYTGRFFPRLRSITQPK